MAGFPGLVESFQGSPVPVPCSAAVDMGSLRTPSLTDAWVSV